MAIPHAASRRILALAASGLCLAAAATAHANTAKTRASGQSPIGTLSGNPQDDQDAQDALDFLRCTSAFTSDHTLDSAAFTFNDGSVAPDSLEARLADARAAIGKVASDLGCATRALELDPGAGRDACAVIAPGNPFSISCYVESAVGYFFVTRDALENVTVVFNRWD